MTLKSALMCLYRSAKQNENKITLLLKILPIILVFIGSITNITEFNHDYPKKSEHPDQALLPREAQ